MIGHPSVVITGSRTVLVVEVGTHLLQFGAYEFEYLTARHLLQLAQRCLGGGDDWYASEEVHQIPVVDGSQRAHLGGVFYILYLIQQVLVRLQQFQRTVA